MDEIVLTVEQELLELKAREAKRKLVSSAAAALKEGGFDTSFADFLAGEDEDETTARVQAFGESFSKELQRQISQRMPEAAPKSFDLPVQKSPRRGIKRK